MPAKPIFNVKKYYSRFPDISYSEIEKCLTQIPKDVFSTSEFIKVWQMTFPYSVNLFIASGGRWRPAVGRRLSLYATATGHIARTKRKRAASRVWEKVP